jgi:tRNA(fMet)-specific endonuclease VapC
VPFILDTDLLTIQQTRSQPGYDRLQARLRQHPAEAVCTSIVNFQEQVQGWLAAINHWRRPAQLLQAYAELAGLLKYYLQLKVLPFDQAAYDRFVELRQQRLGLGTLDLRIASVALVTNSTLLTRNLRDFQRVPGLRVEDWSR